MNFFFFVCVAVLVAVHAKRIENQVPIPAESARLERHAHHHDGGHHHHGEHVDFGAHTGEHGAFGWHADFPVHTDH